MALRAAARAAAAAAIGIASASFACPARADLTAPGISWQFYDQDHYIRRAGVAWDLDRQVVVFFGGVSNLFDHNAPADSLLPHTHEIGPLWRLRHDSNVSLGPRKRAAHAMAYDTVRKKTVLYGGDTRYGTDLTPVPLADMWHWDGATWSRQCDDCGPGPLTAHVMVFDEARGRTVLFGGFSSRFPDVASGATWEHDGTTWIPRCGVGSFPACGPAPRGYAGMAYDVARKRTVLFGGSPGKADAWNQVPSFGDTWEWDGSSWTPRCGVAGTPPCEVPPRHEHGMAYHRERERTSVVFGVRDVPQAQGTLNSAIWSDTWEWDGSSWRAICGTSASGSCVAAGRAGHVAVYRALPTPERHFIGIFSGHNVLPSNLVFYWEDATYAVSRECSSQRDCDLGSCVDGVCCETAFCNTCNRCMPTSGALAQCASVKNADHPTCSSGTCDENGRCRGKKGASTCKASIECASNVCEDGVCCDRPCANACEACSIARGSTVDGVCAPVERGAPGRTTCQAYVCNGRDARCPGACASDADCAPEHACIETSPGRRECIRPSPCASRDVLRKADGALVSCAPYVCEGAGCRTTCASVKDCAAGNVCNLDRTCSPMASEDDDDGGCRASSTASPSGALPAFAVGTWLVCAGVRRRRRRA